MIAASKGYTAIIDVNNQRKSGQTSLMNSIVQSNYTISALLLSSNYIDVNAIRKDGRSALYLAIQYDKTKMIKPLLEKGAIFDDSYIELAQTKNFNSVKELLNNPKYANQKNSLHKSEHNSIRSK